MSAAFRSPIAAAIKKARKTGRTVTIGKGEQKAAIKKSVPTPISTFKDSGIITIRTTSTVHKRLKEKAKEENVSLNHLISNYLAQKVIDGSPRIRKN